MNTIHSAMFKLKFGPIFDPIQAESTATSDLYFAACIRMTDGAECSVSHFLSTVGLIFKTRLTGGANTNLL